MVQEDIAAPAVAASSHSSKGRIDALESEVARLKQELEALWELTGLSDKRPSSG